MDAAVMRRLGWATLCLGLPPIIVACAAAPVVSEALMNAPFALRPEVRDSAVAAAGSAPAQGQSLRAYAARIDTVRSSDREVAPSFELAARQVRGPDGVWSVVSRTRGSAAWGMTRALSLCGLVSLQIETVLTDRDYAPADPDPAGAPRFTDEARLAPDTRMRVSRFSTQGQPCNPRPRAQFSIELATQSLVRGGLPGPDGPVSTAEVRYDCLADPAYTPAHLLQPGIPGDALRVECERQALPDGPSGRVRYLWLAQSRIYLLTEHEGESIAQRYVYSDLRLGP